MYNKLVMLLSRVCGFDARSKRQELKLKLQWIVYQDQLNGWLKSYAGMPNAPEVRV